MSNFKCSECGMINIDCGKEGYKTPREIELEKENEILKEKLKIAADSLNKSLIKGIKNHWVHNTQLGCFFAYLITKDKKIDFSSFAARMKKENIITVTVVPTDNRKKTIDYRLLDDKIEWEDEADEFFIVIVGKV